MRMFTKLVLSGFALVLLVLPGTVLAQDDPATSNTESAAENINVKLQIPLPFIKTDPEGNVDNLKDYIEGVYRLAIGLAAIFAVVMIIIAGYQWMTSGGSSDKTGAAKKRIFNAGIGLILALLAYIILNAITPRLVELRLPKIEPIRSIALDIENTRCDSARVLATLLNEDPNKQYTEQQANAMMQTANQQFMAGVGKISSPDDALDLNKTECNTWYSIFKQSDPTSVVGQCQGYYCANTGESCSISGCRSFYLEGSITWDGVFDGRDVDNIDIYPVCNGNDYGRITQHLDTTGRSFYRFSRQEVIIQGRGRENAGTKRYPTMYDAAVDVCGDGLDGFVMKVEVNDGFGSSDNVYAVGRDCAAPLVNDGASLSDQEKFEFDEIDFSKPAVKAGLFTLSDFQQSVTCNLVINNSFKDYD